MYKKIIEFNINIQDMHCRKPGVSRHITANMCR
jgi:hypothetical protein